jgi:hypothetical protein
VVAKRGAYISAFHPAKINRMGQVHQYDAYKFHQTTCAVTSEGVLELTKSTKVKSVMVACDWAIYHNKVMGPVGG